MSEPSTPSRQVAFGILTRHGECLRDDIPLQELIDEIAAAIDTETARLRPALDAAIRAAKLALFVIRKQDVMPNDSWKAGFEKDMATAEAVRGHG